MNRKQAVIAGSVAFILAVGAALIVWTNTLTHTIHDRLAGKRWSAPTEFYSAPERLIKGQSHSNATIISTLERLEYKEVLVERNLQPGEFVHWTVDFCRQKVPQLSHDA